MKTTITQAQAQAISEVANKLFDLVLDAKGVDEFSPEGRRLYDKIVEGALNEAMPGVAFVVLDEFLNKRGTSH